MVQTLRALCRRCEFESYSSLSFYAGLAQLIVRVIWDHKVVSLSLATQITFIQFFTNRYITCRRHPSRIQYYNVDQVFNILFLFVFLL